MSNTVTITPDSNGNIIRQSRNPEIGYIVLKQESSEVKRGWLNNKTRTALLRGNIDDLKAQKYKKNSKLPGRIVVFETTEPLSAIDPERGLKRAGDGGIICCTADGEPIYRETYWDPSGQDEDSFIPHANGDLIRAAKSATPEELANSDSFEPDFSSAPGVTEEDEEEDTTEEVSNEADEDTDDEFEDEFEDELEEEEEEFEL
jgi:hypothetical protein